MRGTHLKHVAALLIAGMIGFIAWWVSGNLALFFAWPRGETWPNLAAWLEGSATTSMVIWLTRDHLGGRVAAWWHQQELPLLSELLDTHHETVAFPRLQEHLDAHHERVIEAIQNGNGGNGNGESQHLSPS